MLGYKARSNPLFTIFDLQVQYKDIKVYKAKFNKTHILVPVVHYYSPKITVIVPAYVNIYDTTLPNFHTKSLKLLAKIFKRDIFTSRVMSRGAIKGTPAWSHVQAIINFVPYYPLRLMPYWATLKGLDICIFKF